MVEKKDIIGTLNALAHEARLDVFMALVQAGPEGLSAGELAARAGVAANALSFHLTRLRHAGLIQSRRDGKRIIYAANYDSMEALLGFLTDNCCRTSRQACTPVCAERRATERETDEPPVDGAGLQSTAAKPTEVP